MPDFVIGASCKPPPAGLIFRGVRRNWKVQVAISGMMQLPRKHHSVRPMDATRREIIMQRWNVIRHDLISIRNARAVIHILERVRIEEFTQVSWCGVGRPPHERAWPANAFVAKAVLGLTTTAASLNA